MGTEWVTPGLPGMADTMRTKVSCTVQARILKVLSGGGGGGGSKRFFCFSHHILQRVEMVGINIKAGHHRPVSETPFQ